MKSTQKILVLCFLLTYFTFIGTVYAKDLKLSIEVKGFFGKDYGLFIPYISQGATTILTFRITNTGNETINASTNWSVNSKNIEWSSG